MCNLINTYIHTYIDWCAASMSESELQAQHEQEMRLFLTWILVIGFGF